MTSLERDVKRALETFIAEVTRSAERAAIEGVQLAFARVSTRAGAAVVGTGDDLRVFDPSARRRAPTPTNRTSLRMRVLTCIRDNPGWDITQLGRSLGSFPSKLRGPIRELANAGAIWFEERSIGSGEPERRVYFVREAASETVTASAEPANAFAEPAGVSPEAAATSVGAMA